MKNMQKDLRKPLSVVTLFSMVFLLLFFTGCQTKEYIHVGENWKALQELQEPENTFKVTVKGADSAKIGEELQYSVVAAKSGQLWIVQVDSEDNLALLYPQDDSQPNEIRAGKKFLIPPKESSLILEAAEPAGLSMVAFIVTTENADISKVVTESNSMEKAIRLVEEEPAWGIAKKIVEIK